MEKAPLEGAGPHGCQRSPGPAAAPQQRGRGRRARTGAGCGAAAPRWGTGGQSPAPSGGLTPNSVSRSSVCTGSEVPAMRLLGRREAPRALGATLIRSQGGWHTNGPTEGDFYTDFALAHIQIEVQSTERWVLMVHSTAVVLH